MQYLSSFYSKLTRLLTRLKAEVRNNTISGFNSLYFCMYSSSGKFNMYVPSEGGRGTQKRTKVHKGDGVPQKRTYYQVPNRRSLPVNFSIFSNPQDIIKTSRLLILRKLSFLYTPHFISFNCQYHLRPILMAK